MDIKSKIEKAIFSLSQIISDQIKTNIVNAVSTKQLDIKKQDLDKLISLVSSSMNEAYGKSCKSITSSIESLVSEKKN